MTRKRFKKLLMGRFGYSRRDAEDAAALVAYTDGMGKSYEEIYYLYYSYNGLMSKLARELEDAFIHMYHRCCGEGQKLVDETVMDI